ncbi:fimbrial assembly protein [Corynebacterium diphtheriae]|nr:fimbrial assembly protein [Corynebacterium diphtheriae]CAB0785108.1 fimbrial assembly protein [Corynebacterium diphtheriae]
MKKNSLTIRSVTFAAVAGLSLGISAPGAIAVAQEGSQVQQVQKANIDFNKEGKLTIYKRDLAGAKATEGTGVAVEGEAPGKALEGVTFKIQKVKVDLSKAEDWKNLSSLTAAGALQKGIDQSFAEREVTTDQAGKAEFPNLPVGIYVVTETKAPQGVIKGAPFVVSVPFTDAKGTEWNYEPVVYPKNTKAEASKEVSDANKQQGEDITYTVKTPTPALGEKQLVKKYVITDDYDESKVTPKKEGIELTIAGEKIPSDHYSVEDNDGKITITFSNFEKLNAHPSSQVVTTIPATVIAQGEIKNSADVTFNNPNSEDEIEDVTIPTNEVFSYYGEVNVVKKDANEEGKPLEGAKFEVYRSDNKTCGDGDDVQIFKDKEFKTDVQGKLKIEGLHATNIEDNNSLIDKTFCLKEIEAPAGYVTPEGAAAWHSFKIEAVQNKKGDKVVSGGTIKAASLEIRNTKQGTPKLPMTGGAGVGILAAIGAAIVAAGAWFARRGAKN